MEKFQKIANKYREIKEFNASHEEEKRIQLCYIWNDIDYDDYNLDKLIERLENEKTTGSY